MRGIVKRREDTARRAPPGRCFPFYRAFPPVPPGACRTRRGLGRGAWRASLRVGARAPRSARTRQRGASGAQRRGGTRRRRPRPAGGAVRGPRRLPLRTAQSCSRAMFPSGPALREGPRRRRGGGGGGAHGPARRQSRSVPIAGHQAASPRGRAQVLQPAMPEPPGGLPRCPSPPTGAASCSAALCPIDCPGAEARWREGRHPHGPLLLRPRRQPLRSGGRGQPRLI